MPAPALAPAPAGNVKEITLDRDSFQTGAPVPDWVETVAAPASDEPAPFILLLADTQFHVAQTTSTFVHRVVRVNDPSALSGAGQIEIPFVPQYQRVLLHGVSIRRGDVVLDRTDPSTFHFLQRETGLEQNVYSGIVSAVILVPDVRVGDIIEYRYTLLGSNPVFAGRVAEKATWDLTVPIALRRVAFVYPQNRRIRWKFETDGPLPPPEPEQTANNGEVKLVFRGEQLKPVFPENNVPADFRPYGTLSFSEFAGWPGVVQWAGDLFPVDLPIDPQTQKVVDTLIGQADEKARIAAALEFVQTEIRYVSVALGESSHRPAPPAVVLARRYGDCKDKTFLLMTLLRAMNIKSEPVLLQFGQHRGLDDTLPSPLAFNHVILRVATSGKTYYLDATRLGQHGDLDRMGQIHQGSQVLPVAPGSSGPVEIPTPDPAHLAIDDELVDTVHLEHFGDDASLETRQTWTGYRAEVMRALLQNLPHDQVERLMLTGLERRFPEARQVGALAVVDSRDVNRLSIEGHYVIRHLMQERSGNWFASVLPQNLVGAIVFPVASDRKSPMQVQGSPLRLRYIIEATLPETLRLQSDPGVKSVKGPGFVADAATTMRGNVEKTVLEITLVRDRILPQQIPDYNEAARTADATLRVVLLAPKEAIGSTGMFAGAAKPFKETLADRQADALASASKTIAAGRISGSDLAQAYCTRALIQAEVGRTAEALKDADEAVRIAPAFGDAYECRGEVHFWAGELQESVADATRALTFGTEPAAALTTRGLARFYLGRYEMAADDFGKVIEAEDSEHGLYAAMWLALADLRLDRPIPDSVTRMAAADPRGRWPRPALAMVAGLLSSDQMTALLSRATGDDLAISSAEAYFFLGQHFAAAGDPAHARDAFERCRAFGVSNDRQYVAAGYELKRLEAAAAPAAAGPTP